MKNNNFNFNFKITILGSGTCVPSLTRSSCSVLMQTGSSNLLLDCGPGTMHQLLKAGLKIFDISVIFLSHFHLDHSGELAPFLFTTKYFDTGRLQNPLTIVAAKGFGKFYNNLKTAYGQWIEPSPPINIVELDTDTPDMHQFKDFKVLSAPMAHNPESLAYRISTANDVSAVYSGDTDFSENLIHLSKNADLLICESALPDALKVPQHLSPSFAGEIATQSCVKQLVLTHFYPECDDADIEAECRKTYDGPLLLAQDLMQICL